MRTDTVIVSCHYNEDLGWLASQTKYPYAVYSKTGQTTIPHVLCPVNAGAEAEAYLRYVIDNYHNLPCTMVFIHGHDMHWHQDATVMELLESLGDLRQYNYWNINNRWVCMKYDINAPQEELLPPYPNDIYTVKDDLHSYAQERIDLHSYILDEVLPPYTYARVCAQFIVHRDLILRRPIDYWQGLLDKIYKLVLENKLPGKDIGILMEVLWFRILTGENDEAQYLASGRHLRHH